MRGVLSLLIYAATVCLHLGLTDGAVPLNITMCYRDLVDNPIPMDTMSLVSLIRKVENMPDGVTLDLRSMVSTLLHKFRVDGVVRDPDLPTTPDITAVKQDRLLSSKWKVLMGKLLPVNPNLYPEYSLTKAEQCALHVMLSASVDINDCPRKESTDYPNDGCREKGVVYHSSGTVNAGVVLAALTASAQPQSVSLGRLMQKPKDNPSLLKMYEQYAKMGSKAAVDNQWAATLAGDLAEVALFQGPKVSSGMKMGPGGKWDDDLLFRNYTVDIDSTTRWELTDAEIRGGLDGLVLGSKLQQWTKEVTRLRLSQVLEMYYSPRGMSFDQTFRACDRQEKSSGIVTDDKLRTETLNMARVLYMEAPIVTLTDEKLQEFGTKAVDSFRTYMPNVVGKSREIDCEPDSPSPLVQVFAVLDSTWTQKDAARLLVHLAEQIDVGEFSSSLNVLHGRGDTWLVKRAIRTTDVPQQVVNQTDSTLWSSGLNLPKALQAVNTMLGQGDDSTTNSSALPDVTVEGGPGLVVLLLLPTATVNDPEIQLVQEQVKLLRQIRPDATLIAVTSEANKVRFYKMLDSDSVVVSPVVEDSIQAQVSAAKKEMLAVPLRLVPRSCDPQDYNKGVMEHYVTPNVPSKFRVHPISMVEATALAVTVRSYDYGIVNVCLTAPDVTATENDCQELTGDAEAAFNKTVRGRSASTCQPLELTVTVTNSKHKCAEDDCRFPNQVRIGIQSSITCGNGASASGIATVLLLLLPTFFLTQLLR